MRVFVDNDNSGKPTEFAWKNQDGEVEHVEIKENGMVDIIDINTDFAVYKKDIPKLIKALEMVQKQLTEEEEEW